MTLARSTQKNRLAQGRQGPDVLLTVIIALLLIFGLIMISSASVVLSQKEIGNPNGYFFKQLYSVFFGIILFFIGLKINYRYWRKLAPLMLLLSIIALIAVFLPGVGVERNGAHRWVNLGFMQFQPSELTKLSLILYLAVWFENKGLEVKKILSSTIPFILILALIGGLVIKEPDMGTTIVLTMIAGVMYVVAGAKKTHVAVMLVAGIATGWYLIKNAPYRMSRFMVFLNPEADVGGRGYHVNQALLAIGSGGLLGLGFGRSRQKFNYLPEAATDSVFAVTAEELGIIGGVTLLLLFLVFAIRSFTIARNAPDSFSRLVVVGIATWITGQATLNIMAILSLLPLTGVPLPFISYGGSSIIMLLFASGILLNISKHIQKGEEIARSSFWRRNWWSYFSRISGYKRT